MRQRFSAFIRNTILRLLDICYLWLDHKFIRRAYLLRLTPDIKYRTGGKIAYSEYVHTIGVFQTLIFKHLVQTTNPSLLDIGCGTGLLAIASFPLVTQGAHYIGIDVDDKAIKYCRNHFPESYDFQHLNTSNRLYAPSQSSAQSRWDIPDNSQDLVTALSVWTHFNESDALFYMRELERVMKVGSRALITFFVLDDNYEASIAKRRHLLSKYHGALETKWIFDKAAYESSQWYYPSWAAIPEDAIAVTREGLENLLEHSGLILTEFYPGNWREQAGVYFQDVLVFEKRATA